MIQTHNQLIILTPLLIELLRSLTITSSINLISKPNQKNLCKNIIQRSLTPTSTSPSIIFPPHPPLTTPEDNSLPRSNHNLHSNFSTNRSPLHTKLPQLTSPYLNSTTFPESTICDVSSNIFPKQNVWQSTEFILLFHHR